MTTEVCLMLSTWSTMFTGVDRKAERDGYGLRMFVKLLKLKWFWFDLLSSLGEQKIMSATDNLCFFCSSGSEILPCGGR